MHCLEVVGKMSGLAWAVTHWCSSWSSGCFPDGQVKFLLHSSWLWKCFWHLCVMVRTRDLFVIMLYLQDSSGAVPKVTPEKTDNMIWFFKSFSSFFWSYFSWFLYHPFPTPASSQISNSLLITSFPLILILLQQNFMFQILFNLNPDKFYY